MSVTKQEFINELNKDLEFEYAAAIQYIQHAALITGAQYNAITKELVVHANEEMQHAQQLSVLIVDLNGVPTTEVEARKVAPAAEAMLSQDLAGENLAITRYKERIKQAEELSEFGVRKILEDILVDEEEHRRDLLTVLAK